MTALPPELWLCIFHHATYVPGTLVPEIYGQASLVGPIYARTYRPALRETLVTTRALVRVCKQWWCLAIPYLYRSIYIGRARCLSSLSSTLARSAAGKGTIVGTRPLGDYTERLDIAIRGHAENADVESDLLAALITCMPYLSIVSFAVTFSYAVCYPTGKILNALQHSASSLRVLDWSSTQPEPSVYRMTDLLAKCTRLRILNCPRVVWSKELERGVFPPTLTTLRIHGLSSLQIGTTYKHIFPYVDPDTVRRPEPTLRELILDIDRDSRYWEDLLRVYGEELVSVQFYVPHPSLMNIDVHMQLLTRTCPRLFRLTITSDYFPSFNLPHLIFPSIVYLGLRATRLQLPKLDFKTLFTSLDKLRSSVPSLKVVQLLDEHNVRCLLKAHTKLARRALQPFAGDASFRVEDGEGVLLTDRLKALGST